MFLYYLRVELCIFTLVIAQLYKDANFPQLYRSVRNSTRNLFTSEPDQTNPISLCLAHLTYCDPRPLSQPKFIVVALYAMLNDKRISSSIVQWPLELATGRT